MFPTTRRPSSAGFNEAATFQSRKFGFGEEGAVFRQASMRPRPFSRGNLGCDGRRSRALRGFNEAATFQSRK